MGKEADGLVAHNDRISVGSAVLLEGAEELAEFGCVVERPERKVGPHAFLGALERVEQRNSVLGSLKRFESYVLAVKDLEFRRVDRRDPGPEVIADRLAKFVLAHVPKVQRTASCREAAARLQPRRLRLLEVPLELATLDV